MRRNWICTPRVFDRDFPTLLMGVVNVTPDSFSDGGHFLDPSHAIKQAYRLYEEGAHIIDIGGESSRPGAEPVTLDEERKRVIPVIEEIAGKGNLPVSIDTVKYEIACDALNAGASILNDISGLQQEPRFADLVASAGCGYVLMHMRGTPKTMQSLTAYEDVIKEINTFFNNQVDLALQKGVRPEQIVLDPGIGFGKTVEQNLGILNQLQALQPADYPLLLGISRKSFIGAATGKEVEDRIFGTAGAVAMCVLNGADIVRVHDVAEMNDVLKVIHSIRKEAVIT
ncbi:dihydropteroate synthase [bacterium]|nr:dihydropteroate synthase [bacterium]